VKKICYVIICVWGLAACQSSGVPKLSAQKAEKSADIHYQIGINSLYSGNLPKAFDELMTANRVRPNQPKILDALAYAWRLRGNTSKAEEMYRASLAAQSTPSTETNYGSLLIALKRYHEAEVHLRLALEDPRYRNQYLALINLGDALLGQEQFTDAIKSYRQASMMNPHQNIAKLHEAQAYIHVKRWNFAQALYESMLQQNPSNRPALEGIIQVATALRQPNIAKKHLGTYIEHEKAPLNRAWANDELVRLGQIQ